MQFLLLKVLKIFFPFGENVLKKKKTIRIKLKEGRERETGIWRPRTPVRIVSSKVHAEVLQGHKQGDVNAASQLAGRKGFSEQLSVCTLVI